MATMRFGWGGHEALTSTPSEKQQSLFAASPAPAAVEIADRIMQILRGFRVGRPAGWSDVRCVLLLRFCCCCGFGMYGTMSCSSF